MISKIVYWALLTPLIIISAFTSSVAWVDCKFRGSKPIERYVLWCEKVSKIKR
ncbi:hypothetical protein [Salmonella phage ZCSE7]|nr:hypothetical protein [Salmonella phage ZCSE7]